MTSEPEFHPIPPVDPERASLCLPVFNALTGKFEQICTSLRDFPVYLLRGGVRDFFKALVVKHWQKPVDWTFVDEHFDQLQAADDHIEEDELDIVQKRFVMWMKRGPEAGAVYELN